MKELKKFFFFINKVKLFIFQIFETAMEKGLGEVEYASVYEAFKNK